MKNTLVFDIETWPETDDVLDRFATVGPIPKRIEFNPDDVKLGRMKDQDKIDAKIEECRERHEADQDEKCDPEKARNAAMAKVREKACLTGHLSRIYAWGAKDDLLVDVIRQSPAPTREQEKVLVAELIDSLASQVARQGGMISGWNTEGFDIPIVLQRAMILGVKVPFTVRMPLYYNDWSLDLMGRWSWSNRNYTSLNNAAKALGIAGKHATGGKLPWELCVESPKRAEDYLKQDIELTWEIGQRMLNCIPL